MRNNTFPAAGSSQERCLRQRQNRDPVCGHFLHRRVCVHLEGAERSEEDPHLDRLLIHLQPERLRPLAAADHHQKCKPEEVCCQEDQTKSLEPPLLEQGVTSLKPLWPKRPMARLLDKT